MQYRFYPANIVFNKIDGRGGYADALSIANGNLLIY
jgi:hypothetical protein